jgi:hypothetical protein
MLPSRSPALYQEVKVATDAALGVPSQVLVAPVAGVGSGAQPRGRLQYCNNLGEERGTGMLPSCCDLCKALAVVLSGSRCCAVLYGTSAASTRPPSPSTLASTAQLSCLASHKLVSLRLCLCVSLCVNLTGLKINAKLGGVNVRLAGNPDQVCVWVGHCCQLWVSLNCVLLQRWCALTVSSSCDDLLCPTTCTKLS